MTVRVGFAIGDYVKCRNAKGSGDQTLLEGRVYRVRKISEGGLWLTLTYQDAPVNDNVPQPMLRLRDTPHTTL